MVLAFLKSKPWGLRRKTTGFRFYQQIIILVLLIVTIPLGGLSVWLYDINDSALRKQIAATEEDVLRSTLKSAWQEVAFQQTQSRTILRLFQERRFDSLRLNQQELAHFLSFEDDLQFVGVCNVKTGELLQWASKVPPNQWQRKGINTWACGILGSEFASKEQYELLPAWQGQGIEPTWLQSRLPLNSLFSLVQVRTVNTLHSVLADLLHLQKAGVWLALPYPIESRSSVLHLQENNEGAISFGTQDPPQAVLDALFQERVHALRVSSQATIKSLSQQAALPKNLSWKGVRHEDKDYILAQLKPLSTWLIVSPDWHQNRHFLKQARLKIFGLIGGSLLISILIGLGYVLGIVRNFRQLIKGIKAMGEGNYGRQIRLIINWVTPFEIRYLTSEVNRMSRQLEKQVTTIQEANTQLAKLDELKSTLIDTVSHELRTPLMNIQGYTNRLLKHRDALSDDQQVQSLQTIKQQCKRLNRLVEDLLVIPDLENHSLRVYCEDQTLESLWQHLMPLLPEAVQDALNVSFPEGDAFSQWTLSVDEDRWQQVMVNLLENAAKYRREEDDAIHVSFEALGDALTIHISNPSDEITEAQLMQLFEKFHRLDDGLTRRSRGSGLGLFIAKALTEAMEGTLDLSYGDGMFTATVRFSLQD
jgi:signal transduction histidine kinase